MVIFKTGVRTLRFMKAYFVANLQAAMEYRTAFWVQIITMVANDSLWLFFWWTYFRQFPLLHGWQNTDIVILWAISACGFGIAMCIFGNAPKLAALIMNGGLDAYLGMPRNVLLHVCISATDPTAWGDVIFAVGAYVLFLHPDLLHIGLFALLALQVALIFTAFEHLYRRCAVTALHNCSCGFHLVCALTVVAPVHVAAVGCYGRVYNIDWECGYGGV